MESNSHFAFLTGSHAYGTPTEDSDVDLVVLCSEADANILRRLADNAGKFLEIPVGDKVAVLPNDGCYALRFGKLNLLACFTQSAYSAWSEGTEELVTERPVPRQEAVRVFDRTRAKYGVSLRNYMDQVQ